MTESVVGETVPPGTDRARCLDLMKSPAIVAIVVSAVALSGAAVTWRMSVHRRHGAPSSDKPVPGTDVGATQRATGVSPPSAVAPFDERKLVGTWENVQEAQQIKVTTTVTFSADHHFEQAVSLPIGVVRKTGSWSAAGAQVAMQQIACAFEGNPSADDADLARRICDEKGSSHAVELAGDELRVTSLRSARPALVMRRK